MNKKRGEKNIFIWILIYLSMGVIGLLMSAAFTFFVLLAADLIYYDVPSYVPAKMAWRFRTSGFSQRVNWIFAGVVFAIIFIGNWVGLFSRDLKKWLGNKGII